LYEIVPGREGRGEERKWRKDREGKEAQMVSTCAFFKIVL